MDGLKSCLHNRNSRAGAAIVESIAFMIETPEATETHGRARCASFEKSEHSGETGIEP
jgi:hypothetical protein